MVTVAPLNRDAWALRGDNVGRKIGIIGSGIVGETLANGFIKHGYQVTIGTNSAGKREGLRAKTNGRATVGTFEDAAKFGEVVVLATKGSAAEAALKLAGTAHLAGKTVIDTCNPIADTPPVNGVLQYFTPQNESLMERLQKAFPEVRFVKAFSCIGNAFMVDPDFNGEKPTMFICGNDEMAKAEVRTILDSSAMTLPTWALLRARAQSNRSVSCGAFQASEAPAGPMRSSC
jgi:hypothetical protein